MIRLALLPLDDRPACRRLPAMIAGIAGAETLVPPAELLPAGRRAGDADRLAGWLADVAPGLDAVVASLETLGLGGLIPSRIGYEPVGDVLPRWAVLAEITAPLYAATVVQRTPDADDGSEEPDYWAHHGRALHAYSAALYASRAATENSAVAEARDLSTAREKVPAELRRDFLRRRHRNHILNQLALSMAADGQLQTLVIGADDSAGTVVGAAEWRWLRSWVDWLECGDRVLAHPGADEIGSVLTARALARAAGVRPRIALACAEPDGLQRTARYEPAPIAGGAASQIAAVGGILVEAPAEADLVEASADADLVLVVHPPQLTGYDWATAPPSDTDPDAAAATADLVTGLLARGHRVAVADCALGNGADPGLVEALLSGDGYAPLLGFGAWNTAGNTIGGVLAQAVAYLAGEAAGTLDHLAHHRLLTHRLVEDHCYMSWARPRVRAELGTDPTRHDSVPPGSAVPGRIEELLATRLAELDRLAAVPWRVVPGSVSLPWSRTYEIDFELERR
ncbi:MAG: DUF4127 family protein [Micromonosporaceae bacterium]